MGAAELVRTTCLALPGTHERPTHGSAGFFVGTGRGRLFASLGTSDRGDVIGLRLWCAAAEGAQAALVASDPTAYFVPPYVGHRGWVGLRLEVGVADDGVRGLIEDAWLAVAPARLVRALDEG